MKLLSIAFLFCCFVVGLTALAQADCPALVDVALSAVDEICTNLSRNQACYGNVMLEATAREGSPEFVFEQAGDIVQIEYIETLRLSSMSLTEETWGIALMLLQANLPNTLPGQNATVLMFGDVEIVNAVDNIVELDVTANANVNVRLRPTTSGNNIISSLARGDIVTANGRLEDGSWMRILLDEDTREVGWVSADLVSSEDDLETLTVVDGDTPLYAPLQAFYFASGIGDSQCNQAPDSGILIQTPQDVGEINLLINEVNIRLGSTVYMQAGNGVMTLSVVEGSAVVEAGGVTQTVPAGTFVQIPLDAAGAANGTPTYPQPYNESELQALPVTVALPRQISIAPALEAEEVQAAIDVNEGTVSSGNVWRITFTITTNTCDPEVLPVGRVVIGTPTITFSEDRSSFVLAFGDDASFTFNRSGDNVYTHDMSREGATNIWTITFTSATTLYSYNSGIAAGNGCQFIEEGPGVLTD